MAEMVPEPMRMDCDPAFAAATGNQLADAVGRQRPAVVHPQPQRAPPRLSVPGPHPDAPVQDTGRSRRGARRPRQALAGVPGSGQAPSSVGFASPRPNLARARRPGTPEACP
jgi:hypothetical protein